MRILFVSPRLCFPLFNGARLREYYLARALSEHAEVTYVSFVFPGFPVPTQADVPFFRETHILPLTGRNNPLLLARGLLGRWPLTVVNYTRAAMKRTLAEILARQKFDLVHLDGTYLAAYVPFLQAAGAGPVVFDWHNIESELLWRYSAGMRFLPKKIYAAITARRMAATEAWLLRASLGHTVCSAREQAQLLALEPAARVEVIDNGVDTGSFSGTGPQPVRDRIVFVGALNYHPNIEAAVWFVGRVWPRVSASFPHWRLTLVGCHPGPAVRELAKTPGVEVTGTVPDVRPFYREAVAAIVPLLTGGGTRLKILEAMAAGVPVVSSSLGAEGLAVSPAKDILIADGEDAWLPAIGSLAADGARWDALSAAGSQLVRSRYDWRVLGERLYQTYARWLAGDAQ
jgi:glycosyltransferase involved in cell wall biosynthesis